MCCGMGKERRDWLEYEGVRARGEEEWNGAYREKEKIQQVKWACCERQLRIPLVDTVLFLVVDQHHASIIEVLLVLYKFLQHVTNKITR